MAYIGNAPAAGIVNSGNILDGSINTADLADAAVTAQKLAAAAITDKLGYTPVNKAGDTMSGSLSLPGVNLDGNYASIRFVAAASGDCYIDAEPGTRTIRTRNWNGATPNIEATAFKTGTLIPYYGVQFSSAQHAHSDPNMLDDYEEGTWTPTVTSGGWTVSSINRCTYTKIGNRVWIQSDFSISGSGNSNQLVFGGLPFTVISGGWCSGSSYFAKQNTDYWNQVALPSSGTTSIIVQTISTSGVGGTMIGTDIGVGYVNLSAFYEVA